MFELVALKRACFFLFSLFIYNRFTTTNIEYGGTTCNISSTIFLLTLSFFAVKMPVLPLLFLHTLEININSRPLAYSLCLTERFFLGSFFFGDVLAGDCTGVNSILTLSRLTDEDRLRDFLHLLGMTIG